MSIEKLWSIDVIDEVSALAVKKSFMSAPSEAAKKHKTFVGNETCLALKKKNGKTTSKNKYKFCTTTFPFEPHHRPPIGCRTCLEIHFAAFGCTFHKHGKIGNRK